MEVVVVLPWVPAIAMPCRSSMRLASAVARCNTRTPRLRAATSSGLSGRIADDTTIVSTPVTWSALCPSVTSAPSSASSSSCAEGCASQPETGTPLASMMRAMPDMPAPPMATKCTRPSSATGTGLTGVISAIIGPGGCRDAGQPDWGRPDPVPASQAGAVPAAPGTGVAGTAVPGTAVPGTGVPGTGVAGTAVPGTGVAGTGAPGTAAPAVAPGTGPPGTAAPAEVPGTGA